MATLTPEQFAELQRTNPQLADQIMRNETSNFDNARSPGADWLGTDGMPMRVSSDTATNASMKTGKQDRGVPANAPRPPKRPATIQGEDRAPANSRTPRGSGNDGAGKSRTADDEAAPMSTPQPPRRPEDLTQSPPSTTDSTRIAAEVFGPDISEMQSPTPIMDAARAGVQSVLDRAGTQQSAERTAVAEAPIVPQDAPVQTPPQDTSWLGMVKRAFGPDPRLVEALAAAGIDFNKLSPQDRTQAGILGAEKFLARNAKRTAADPRRLSRQEQQR